MRYMLVFLFSLFLSNIVFAEDTTVEMLNKLNKRSMVFSKEIVRIKLGDTMKILIAVGSKEFSGPTLQVGMKVAKAFNASTTIVDVGKKIGKFDSKVAVLAQERMESWEFERPGVDVLEWAFQYLEKNNFIESQIIEAGFPKNTLVETGASRAEVYLKGTVCEDVKLILRNGNIISELREEVQSGNYDVTIIGGSQKRRMAHDLIQYIDSSIFVVNQIDTNRTYRILLAVNDSKGTKKAVRFSLSEILGSSSNSEGWFSIPKKFKFRLVGASIAW